MPIMHDKPEPVTQSALGRPAAINRLIAELENTDPAAAPNIADEIAGLLENELAGGSAAEGSG